MAKDKDKKLDKTRDNKPKRDKNGRLLPGNTANKDGRPKTTKEEKDALKIFKKKVRKHVRKLFITQFNLAMGCSYLFVIKTINQGKKNERNVTEKVTSPVIIEAYLGGELDDDNEKEYYYISTDKPDNRAIDSLLDRTFGKAMQSTKLEGDKDNPIALLLQQIYDKKEPLVKPDSGSLRDNKREKTKGDDGGPGVAPKQSVLDQRRPRGKDKV